MKPELGCLHIAIHILVISCGFFNVFCSTTNLSTSTVQDYEECVVSLLSTYPFFNTKNLNLLNKMLQKHSERMKKYPEGIDEGKEIRHFSRNLVELVIVNDSLISTRETALISAIERCSLLTTGKFDSEMRSAVLAFRPPSEVEEVRSTKKKDLKPFVKDEKLVLETYKPDSKFAARIKRDITSFERVPLPTEYQGHFGPVDSPLESMINDVLLNSPVFADAFHVGIPQQIVKSYSSIITEAGLDGFDRIVVNDAINAVVNDISSTTWNTNTRNYAFIISKAISSVLQFHNLMFVDGVQIANSMLRKLETFKGNLEPIQQPYPLLGPADEIVPPELKIERKNVNPLVGISMIAPSPVSSMQIEDNPQDFKDKLSRLLSESREMSNLFCNGALPNVLRTVKMGLSDYGLILSLNTAIAVTNALDELGTELACSQFANIVAEKITNNFYDNGILGTVEATEVLRNLVSNVKTPSGKSSFPQRPQVLGTPADNFASLSPSFSDVSTLKNQEPVADVQYPDYEAPNSGMVSSSSSNSAPLTEDSNSEKSSLPHYDFPGSIKVFPIQEPPKATDVSITENVGQPESGFTFKTENLELVNSTLVTSPQSNNTNVKSEILFNPLPVEVETFLPKNSSVLKEDSSVTADNFTYVSTFVPYTISTDDLTEIIDSDGFLTTFMEATDFTTATPDPYIKNLTDAIDNPSKLAALFMENIDKSLKALSSSDSSANKDDISKTGDPSKSVSRTNEEKPSTNPVERIKNATETVKELDSENYGTVSEIPTLSSKNGENSQSDDSYAAKNETFSSKIELSDALIAANNSENNPIRSQQNITENAENSITAGRISSISLSSIAFIKSFNFNLFELCNRLNELAEIVGIAPIPADNCSEIALIDYLLHVLNTYALKAAKTT